jgi:colicin import membrane protein
MDALSRIKRILQAVVQDIIRNATDPELELAKFVEKAELSLGEVRAELEEAGLRRDALKREAVEQRQAATQWMEKAERAAAAERDDAAKEALRRHRQAGEDAEGSEERLAEAELTVATLRKDEAELEHKLREAQLEQKRLSIKLRRAEAEQRAAGLLFRSEEGGGPAQETQERIRKAEAAGEALREVHQGSREAGLHELGAPASVDEELAELKRRLRRRKARGG